MENINKYIYEEFNPETKENIDKWIKNHSKGSFKLLYSQEDILY